MKTVLLFLGLFLFISSPMKAQWISYNTGVPYSLFSVDFDWFFQTGLAVGQGGTVLRTTDNGNEWTLVYSNNEIWLNDVKFVSVNIAYAAGMGGVIIRTVDGGTTWQVVRPFDTPMHTIRGIGHDPANPSHVHFVGYAGTYFETFNGGNSFIQRTDIPFTMHSIDFSPHFPFNSRGIICGTDGKVWNTTNYGVNWVARNSGRYDYLNDVIFINDVQAFIVGNNGTVLSSDNWGRTWSVIPTFTSQHLRSVDYDFFGPHHNLTTVGDNGTIYTSQFSGVPGPWVNQSPFGETRHFYGVSLYSTANGTVVGEVGTGLGNTGMMFNSPNMNPVGITQTGSTVPQKYSLNQNFPNPFNPVTKISFSMAKSGPVRLTVFDMSGKEVAVLINSKLSAGNFEYTFDGSKLSSGVYFYRITTNDFVDTKKMTLLK